MGIVLCVGNAFVIETADLVWTQGCFATCLQSVAILIFSLDESVLEKVHAGKGDYSSLEIICGNI